MGSLKLDNKYMKVNKQAQSDEEPFLESNVLFYLEKG